MIKDKTRLYLNIALAIFGLGVLLFHNLASISLFGFMVAVALVIGIKRQIK